MAAESIEALARRASDELSIMRTLSRVARAQDDLDPAAFRACFADTVLLTATVMFGAWEPKEIPADEFTRMTFERLRQAEDGSTRAGHHMIFNHLIDIDDDTATCDADMYAVSVREDANGATSAAAGGRYLMRLVRRGNAWLICERSVKLRYRYGDLALFGPAAAPAPTGTDACRS